MYRRISLTAGAGFLLCVAAMPFGSRYLPIALNVTASLPLGIYLKTNDRNAPDMIFCLDAGEEAEAIRLGVRKRGYCQDGSMPEVKPVYVATAGKPIVFTPSGFVIGGKLLPNTAPVEKTPSGRRLNHYPFGTYAVGNWAISSYAALSFDSRYFGPVMENQIISRARPLWTW